MRFLSIVICFLFLAFSTNTSAQSKLKLLNTKKKVNNLILNGYFYKAQKTNNQYITDLQHISSKDELAFAYLNQAKISCSLDKEISQWEKEINSGLALILQSSATNNKIIYYAKTAEIYNNYGDYNKAKKHLTLAKEFDTKKVGEKRIEHLYYLTIAEANFNIQQGNYSLAINSLNEYSGKFKKSIKRSFSEVKGNKVVSKKIAGKFIDEDLRKYADLLHLQTKAFLSSGDFNTASKLLDSTNIWVTENINKRDISYIDNKILEGEVALAEEDYQKASKIFDKIYNKYIHRSNHGVSYKPTSPKYLNFIGLMATAHWLNESNSSAQEVYNHIEPQIKRYYEKSTAHISWINALKGQKYYHKGNFPKAITIFEDVLNDTFSLTKDHPYRLNISKYLLDCYIAQKDYKKPVELILEINRLNLELNIENSPTFYKYKLQEAIYITKYSNDINKATDAFTIGLQTIKDGGIYSQSPEYIEYKNDKALYLVEFNKLSEALDLIKKTTAEVLETYGYAHFRYGKQLERLSNLFLITGNYSLAYKNALKSREIIEAYNNKQLDLAQSLRTFANACIVRGQFRDAEKALKKAQDISNNSSLTLDIDEFSRLYIDNGEYSRVETILLASLQRKRNFFGEKNKHVLEPLKQLTELYLILGDYPQASGYNDQAIKLSEEIFGLESLQYSSCLKQKADINSAIGDYLSAVRDYQKVLALEIKYFGENTIIPAETSMKLAINKYYGGESNDNIESTLINAVKVIENSFEQKDNPLVAKALTTLAIYQVENNKLELAESNLIRADEIWKKRTNLEKGNKHTAKILTLRAAIHAYKFDYNKALNLYSEAATMYKKIFSSSHPDYVHTYSKLGQMYYISGDEKKALKITEESAKLNMMLVKTFFPALSERGKAQFWATHQSDFEFYNTLAFKYYEKKPALAANVYNFILSTKYLLLNSSLKVRQSILSSGNEELITKFRLYQSKREDLFKTMTAGQDVITTNTEKRHKLEKEIEDLEKELSSKSELFNSSIAEKSITWKDLKNTLSPNENAVEIIRYRYFDKSFSDSIIYVALIINKETKKAPAVVILPNGSAMEQGYLKHYRNSVKFRIKDTKSYNNYWKPIAELVKLNSTIYLSAEGAYTQINMETFSTPTDNYLINDYNLVLLTNTKDLLKTDLDSTVKNPPAFFANPSYYSINDNSTQHKNKSNKQNIRQLSGAEHEIMSIEKVLDENNETYDNFVYNEATEAAVKALKSPKFLHLATHGYFIKDVDISHIQIDNNRALENPLLKSGLLFANAGDIMENEEYYNYNKEDGVLTSLEAMNLNLDHTEFVILSACETGLGEVKNGEGVYGLQRALQLAGAKTIFMSLFKVDDKVTDKLMTLFYKNYLISHDKRQAFVQAKKELMKEYDSPYFWGSFVMIE